MKLCPTLPLSILCVPPPQGIRHARRFDTYDDNGKDDDDNDDDEDNSKNDDDVDCQ